jgi:farnesyl-diphosphate farnesyltransferase
MTAATDVLFPAADRRVVAPLDRVRRRAPTRVPPEPTRREELQRLLQLGSRTFALNIPYLPDDLFEAMAIAYLLLRNADSLEDAWGMEPVRRIQGLADLDGLIQGRPDPLSAREFAARHGHDPRIEDPGHREVMRATPWLLDELSCLAPAARATIQAHVGRIVRRMIFWVGESDAHGRIEVGGLRELDEYCYSVAGIVGEMITELFAAEAGDLEPGRVGALRALSADFGVGLQLTNILKDCRSDAREGRSWLPRGFRPEPGTTDAEAYDRIAPVLSLALARLDRAVDYTCTLPTHHDGLRRFCLLPVLLAGATLVQLASESGALAAGQAVRIDRERVADLIELADVIVEHTGSIREVWTGLTAPLREAGERWERWQPAPSASRAG